MRWQTLPLVVVIVAAMIAGIACIDSCGDPPAMVREPDVDSLCEYTARRQRETLYLCRDTVDELRRHLCACRGIQDACSEADRAAP